MVGPVEMIDEELGVSEKVGLTIQAISVQVTGIAIYDNFGC